MSYYSNMFYNIIIGMNDPRDEGSSTGLQIGGTVGPNDKVGMHVVMPVNPGVGVKVDISPEFDEVVKKVAAEIPSDHPKAAQIKKLAEEIVTDKDKQTKLQKIHTLVMKGAGITQIATGIQKLTELLGF